MTIELIRQVMGSTWVENQTRRATTIYEAKFGRQEPFDDFLCRHLERAYQELEKCPHLELEVNVGRLEYGVNI